MQIFNFGTPGFWILHAVAVIAIVWLAVWGASCQDKAQRLENSKRTDIE